MKIWLQLKLIPIVIFTLWVFIYLDEVITPIKNIIIFNSPGYGRLEQILCFIIVNSIFFFFDSWQFSRWYETLNSVPNKILIQFYVIYAIEG